MTATVRLADLLNHLYVLLPVLDDDKHYWVGDDEARKLLDKGGTWLASHPARELISRRYLKHRRSLADDVLARLADDAPAPQAEVDEDHDREEEPKRTSDQPLRVSAVVGERPECRLDQNHLDGGDEQELGEQEPRVQQNGKRRWVGRLGKPV